MSGKSMRVRPESVTHLVVKLFNVKSKFDYINKNQRLQTTTSLRSEIMPVIFKRFVCPKLLKNCSGHRV